ncbi:kelch repeat-containing protein [Nonlabens sp. YIK11]|uniref:kelch repeat-containing protein n=1 Tax=Nonlabens sp. YIK11 TaxID=1453349 RepID=UPI0006DBF04D|nr:kelch repeat-containing protein [Nonlabens sp. YIK11]
MKKTLLFLFCIIIGNSIQAQESWIPVAGFQGNPRAWASGFSIGDKGYISTGGTNGTYYNDLWEYDPTNDTWTQKADVGGSLRGGAISFSVDGIGYLGLGGNSSGQESSRDIWEYNPDTNRWSFNSFIPGSGLRNSVAFVINDKAYLGTGSTLSSVGNETNDFWEFNPKGKIWTRKANVPGEVRTRAVGFASDSKGYIGLGKNNQNEGPRDLKDFYEYDTAKNVWTKKSDYPGNASTDCVFFALNNYGYAGMGYQTARDFWRYDFENGEWTEAESFWGNGRIAPTSFSINNVGYMGLGYTTNAAGTVEFNDFWKFEDATLSIEETLSTKTSISIFPNPVRNELNYSLAGGKLTQPETIEIKNLHGQTIEAIDSNTNNGKADVAHLSAGMYFITIKTRQGDYTKPFLKR